MVDFVVWLKNSSQIQGAGGDLGAEFQKQLPTLVPVFQNNANVKIVMTGKIGVYCQTTNTSEIDALERVLPTQWAIDRAQYKADPL